MQAEGTEGALLEGSSGGIRFGDVVPSAAVDLLAANQSDARADEVVVEPAMAKLKLKLLPVVQRQGLDRRS